jgi:hypothetical protein
MLLTKLMEISPGIQQYALDLGQLYPDDSNRARFEARWDSFVEDNSEYRGLFARRGDLLVYQTESFLPPFDSSRTPVLLLLGNPALQSVQAGMCFAFERGSLTEHRFWRALRTVGWLSFDDAHLTNGDVAARNASRRKDLLSAAYESPFLIGIEVFYSFPSPASLPKWAGVAGLVRLFGQPAVRAIAAAERSRLGTTIAAHGGYGAVVAFQRDAYEYLRDPSTQPYSVAAARAGTLSCRLAAGQPVRLFAAPPTRFAHTQAFREVLHEYRRQISSAPLQSD